MSSWKYSLKQLVYLLPLMKSVHKIHFPPFRSHYKSNLVSISEIRGGPQKPLGHLVHTERNWTSKKASVSPSEEDDEVPQRRNFKLLSTTAEGSSATNANPVKEILQMRRKSVTQEANSCKDILNVCPYLRTPSQVSKFSVFHYNILKKSVFSQGSEVFIWPKPKKVFSPCLVLRCCLLLAKIHPRRR